MAPDNEHEEPLCRICHAGSSEGDLYQVCNCKGTMAKVHANCLILWMKVSLSTKCELCQEQYAVRKKSEENLPYLEEKTIKMHLITLLLNYLAFRCGDLIVWAIFMFFIGVEEQDLYWVFAPVQPFATMCAMIIVCFVALGLYIWEWKERRKRISSHIL